jgi:DNA-binding NtrC family response regulator
MTQEDVMRARPSAGRQSEIGIIGQSPAVVQLRSDIVRLAPFPSNVLITGPTGTGKDLVARQIHLRSPRSQRPFIPVDCASMTGELMASQLFGHVAGAFTGANCDALGCVRAANHGTLFLDEIGELDYHLQAKLLRVLQEHVVTPVGSHVGQEVDVRIIAATNRNLRVDVHEGRFREDLYYRLDVAHLRTTPLCDRPEDIGLLADAFLGQLAAQGLPACEISSEGRGILMDYDWAGNVRQLRNVLEQATIHCDGKIISAALLRSIISLSLEDDVSTAEQGWPTFGAGAYPLRKPSLHTSRDVRPTRSRRSRANRRIGTPSPISNASTSPELLSSLSTTARLRPGCWE